MGAAIGVVINFIIVVGSKDEYATILRIELVTDRAELREFYRGSINRQTKKP
jgi:hypothetical protein